MYIPKPFRMDDPETLHRFIETNSFGMLVSGGPDGPLVTHLPFLLDRANNRLLSHLAKPNDHWRHAGTGTVMIVFAGPHAYISPTWYEEEPAVPTWNYVAVHVYGKLRLIEGAAEKTALLRDTIQYYEAAMPNPWGISDWDSPYLIKMLDGIVAFEIAIERLEGKAKLSQNHSTARQQRVIAALKLQEDPSAKAIAALMEERQGT